MYHCTHSYGYEFWCTWQNLIAKINEKNTTSLCKDESVDRRDHDVLRSIFTLHALEISQSQIQLRKVEIKHIDCEGDYDKRNCSPAWAATLWNNSAEAAPLARWRLDRFPASLEKQQVGWWNWLGGGQWTIPRVVAGSVVVGSIAVGSGSIQEL